MHYCRHDSGFPCPTTDLKTFYQNQAGVFDGAVLTVASYLISEEFTVTVKIVSNDDIDQGWHWGTVQLIASW